MANKKIVAAAKATLRRNARRNHKMVIDQAELDQTFFENSGGRFPPILNVQQAAELLQVSINTIYEWSSKGYLKGCSRKHGKPPVTS